MVRKDDPIQDVREAMKTIFAVCKAFADLLFYFALKDPGAARKLAMQSYDPSVELPPLRKLPRPRWL